MLISDLEFERHPLMNDIASMADEFPDMAKRHLPNPKELGEMAIEEFGDINLSVVRGSYWVQDGCYHVALIRREDGEMLRMEPLMTADQLQALIDQLERDPDAAI